MLHSYEVKEYAVYTILGYVLYGHKVVQGVWLSESKNYWIQIFAELKFREVEDVFFISTDGLSGLGEEAKATSHAALYHAIDQKFEQIYLK